MAVSVSATVEPVATQPGKSGTYAEKLAPASSITIAYFIGESPILQASLFKDTVEGSRCQVVRRFSRNSYTVSLAVESGISLILVNGDRVWPQSGFKDTHQIATNFVGAFDLAKYPGQSRN